MRDCGAGHRVEIVHALGHEASFGWLDALDVTRLGASRCADGLVLLQSPATHRIVVAESPSSELAVGDEIARFGGEPIHGLFDSVIPVFPHDVCASWIRGAVIEVVRDGERRRVVRDDAE